MSNGANRDATARRMTLRERMAHRYGVEPDEVLDVLRGAAAGRGADPDLIEAAYRRTVAREETLDPDLSGGET